MADEISGADLIAGFPTETEAKFESTLSLIGAGGLTHLAPTLKADVLWALSGLAFNASAQRHSMGHQPHQDCAPFKKLGVGQNAVLYDHRYNSAVNSHSVLATV